GVVDEHLDVLAQVVAVPEGLRQLRVAVGQAAQHAAHGGRLGQGLVEHAPAGAVATDEARHPARDLDGDGSRFGRRGLPSLSSYFFLRSATTPASASVVVSPSTRPSATSRRSRRMILPLRVLGSSAEKMMSSGRASAPIFLATWALIPSLSASLCGMPVL